MLAVFLILALILPTLTYASDEATVSATIHATVPSNAGPATGDQTPPSIPILIRPHDGTYTNNRWPEFVWLASIDQNSNFVGYHLYINNVATYLGISSLGNSLTHNYTARLEDGSIRLIPLQALSDGVYDWYVVAYDLAGNESRSTTWHFTIDSLAPELTLIQAGHYDNPVVTSDTILTFPSDGTTPFVLGSDPWATITLVLIHSEQGTTFNQTLKAGQNGQVTFSPNLQLGSYQVHAAATDLAGNSFSLPIFTLHVGQPIPGASSPLQPSPEVTPLSSLPASILLAATRLQSADAYFYLIALAIIILLLSRRKPNLKLINCQSGRPIVNAKVQSQAGSVSTTNKHGKCYIKHLHPHSVLTITYSATQYEELPLTLCLLKLEDPTTTIAL